VAISLRSLGLKAGMLALVILGVLLGYAARGWLSPPGPVEPASTEAGPAPADEAAVQLWTCSMHPQIRKTEPGRCPVCAMPLVPVAAPTKACTSRRAPASTP